MLYASQYKNLFYVDAQEEGMRLLSFLRKRLLYKNWFYVDAQEEGMRLLSFLRKRLLLAPSVKAIKRAIEAKGCLVNGQIETFSTQFLQTGDRVEIDLELIPTQKIKILHEEKDLFLIDKPAGVVSEIKNFNSLPFPLYLVHRLDKETSGILVLARSLAMKKQMEELFAMRKVEKWYLAVVDGEVKQKEGYLETFFEKKHTYQGQTIWGSGKKGVKAVTFWKCLSVKKGISLLHCQPITGRTHQLRVHLSEMGHPILGDVQYGKEFRSTFCPRRHLLHAERIRFLHIDCKAPLPRDYEEHFTR